MRRSGSMLMLLAVALVCAAPAAAQQAGDLDGPMTENPGYNHPEQKPEKKAAPAPAWDPNAPDLPETPVPLKNTSGSPQSSGADGGQASSSTASKIPPNASAPRSDNESSSETNRIDLSPPPGADPRHPDGTSVAGELLHQREWSPLRCMKDVEVGRFYYKQENYKAALSRFREALEYKPRDAEATFRLAETLEKMKQVPEALQRYEEYLSILKDGPHAAEAHKALDRLQAQPAAASSSPGSVSSPQKP
ncbi:MAG: tetratricopeptide repeat protein [Acidobacteriota bacterium]|nr:tetratricopeptide repeat protein [Acidobacteriota bacterium]